MQEDFQGKLDTLVLLLQAANEVPEMAEPALIADMIGEIMRAPQSGPLLPGVGELLRSWKAALQDLARGGGTLEESELVQVTMWFMALQEHVAGRLDGAGRAMLAQMPENIRWLPRLSPAFAREIARRLHGNAHIDSVPPPPDVNAPDVNALEVDEPDVAELDVAGPDAAVRMPDLSTDTGIVGGAVDATRAENAESESMIGEQPFGEPGLNDSIATETILADAHAANDDAQADDRQTGSTRPTVPPELLAALPQEFLDHYPADALADFPPELIAELLAQMPSAVEARNDEDRSDDSAIDGFAIAAPAVATSEIGEVSAIADANTDTDGVEGKPADAFESGFESAFENGFDGAFAESDSIATGRGAGADLAGPPIWVGQEELDLTRQAVVEQLLPLAQAWADTPDQEASAAIVDELAYQCRLVGNVLELIGTPALAFGMDAVRGGLETRHPAITPETVATWCSVLIAVIEQPAAESAELLRMAGHDLDGLDDAWSAMVADELARIVIGQDPKLIAERKTVAVPEDVVLAPADDVLPSVLDGMLRELPDNAARLGAAVRALAESRSFEPIDEARRVAHTLKGDANTVGVRGLANLTHALEDILIVLTKQPERLDDDCAELLTSASDCVEEMADHLLGRGPAPEDALSLYQHVLDVANALADGGAAAVAPRERSATAEPAAATQADATAPAAQASMAASGIQSLNVPSSLLDELQRLAGESLVTSRQIDQQLESLGSLHREQRQGVRGTQELMSRLDDLVALRGAALQSTAQKAGAELDPLEIDQYNELHVISRQLLEAHADSAEFMRRIERIMNFLGDLRSGQEQLNRDLQRTILRTRTVPFGQISARLQRIVRQTAKQVLKSVQLDIIGEDIPLDAELLERVVEPLAHVLRNALDHGIEPPEQRLAAGKPDTGRIAIRIGLQGDAATIEIQDDGRGLDFDAIRRRAIEAGLIEDGIIGETAADAAHPLDERQLTRLILLPGFSTRSTASEVSGRGIGMDVVNQRIAALRGSMSIASERGRGMRVQLRLPVTQTLANVIIARGQRQVSAVVASSVERVVSFAAHECRYEADDLRVTIGAETLPALPIETLYDAPADIGMWLGAGGTGLLVRDADGHSSVVLVRAIDEVRSVVVKPISAYLPAIPAVRGITQLGDGGLAPVLDLDQLLQSAQERKYDVGALSVAQAPATRVVVADDSLSVRRALEQLMQDAGFEVAVARDGFEALAAIQAKPTHALLVDLEMPRMNGLEVTRSLRTHSDTRDLPVVMITSRATDKHQAMAEQAGVTRMLGKPFSEDSLVALVRALIAERSAIETTA